jgi:hypothetical protein
MMAQKPETVLQGKIQSAVRRQFAGYWWKNHGTAFSKGGLPDIMGIVNGIFFALEVKLPGEQPTKRQLAVCTQLEAGGAKVAIVYSVEEAVNYVSWSLSN